MEGEAADKSSDTSPFTLKFKSNKCHYRETLTRNGDITVITRLSLSLQLFYIMIQSCVAERSHSQSPGILLRSTQEAVNCVHAVDSASKLHCTHVSDPALGKIGKYIPQ